MDNSSVHWNRKVRSFLKRYPEIRLHFLPTYSPEYNPIEKVWWWLKPKLHGLRSVGESLQRLLKRIRRFIWHYNKSRLLNPLTLQLAPYQRLIEIYAD